MKGTRAASRYAKSLLSLAIEQGKLEEVYADMVLINKTIDESHDLELLLKSPVVNTDQKQSILSSVFNKTLNEITSKFIQIITVKRREELLEAIASSFISQYRISKNIVTAEVTTAVPLDAELRKKVLDVIKNANNKEVKLIEKVDSDILGGIIIRMGDTQLDASIARKINDLKQEFSKNLYVAEY